MEKKLRALAVCLVPIAVWACGTSEALAPFVCSTAALQGSYAVQRNGFLTPAVHLASVGLATFDGNGHISVQETLSQNGTFSPLAHAGTYAIAADCTGTENDASGVPIANLVLVHAGDEIIGQSLVPGSNAAVHYNKVIGICSNATLNGSYGFQRNGVNASGQLLSLGRIAFDGAGHQVVRQTIDRAGTFSTVDQVGTYDVQADCRGTQSDTITGVFSNIVVAAGGDIVLGISLTPGNSIVVHYEREAK